MDCGSILTPIPKKILLEKGISASALLTLEKEEFLFLSVFKLIE